MNQDLAQLVSSILEADKTLSQQAARAVNVSLTQMNLPLDSVLVVGN
jgi:hypothetical protein